MLLKYFSHVIQKKLPLTDLIFSQSEVEFTFELKHLPSIEGICITEVPDSFLLSVVVEYIHSLAQHSVTPRQFVFELMINLCVRTNR